MCLALIADNAKTCALDDHSPLHCVVPVHLTHATRLEVCQGASNGGGREGGVGAGFITAAGKLLPGHFAECLNILHVGRSKQGWRECV